MMPIERSHSDKPNPAAVPYAAAAFGFDMAAQAMRFWTSATVNALQLSQKIWSDAAQQHWKLTLAAHANPPVAPKSDAALALPALRERAKKFESAKVLQLKREPKPAELVADDLKAIPGIGPKLEQTLRDLGVTTYAQIALWTAHDIAEMDKHFGFSGRIARDGWVERAAALSGETRAVE